MEKIIKDYLRGEEDQCLVQLITGERGSGKTTLLMKEMKWALDAIPNMKILFVCPVFKYESTGKYQWMLQPKYQKKITVFLKYKPALCKAILDRDPDRPGASRLWLVLEDVGSVGSEFLECEHAKNLWGVARHLECNITVLFHALRSGRMLGPYIRGNLNVLTAFRTNSINLLKNVYEELISMSKEWNDFKEFRDSFIDLTSSHMEDGRLIRSFQAMTIDLASGIVDQNTKLWTFDDAQLYRHGTKRKNGDSRADSAKTQRAAPRAVQKALCEEEGEEAGDN